MVVFILGTSQITQLPQLPLKTIFDLKVIKTDSKIILSSINLNPLILCKILTSVKQVFFFCPTRFIPVPATASAIPTSTSESYRPQVFQTIQSTRQKRRGEPSSHSTTKHLTCKDHQKILAPTRKKFPT